MRVALAGNAISYLVVSCHSAIITYQSSGYFQHKSTQMTPAVTLLQQHKIEFKLHEYEHDSHNRDYGIEAVTALQVSAQQVFKTLVINPEPIATNNKQLAVAVVPVAHKLNFKAAAKALQCKKVAMADPAMAEIITGYITGGISPLGQKKRLPTLIDSSAFDFSSIYISAGRRGLEIELAPSDLQQLLSATTARLT